MKGMVLRQADLNEYFEHPAPPLDFLFSDLGFLVGTVGVLVAPGATGKTYFGLQAACALAGGTGADILGLSPCATGRVVYIALEDPASVLHARLHAIGKRLSAAARDAVVDRLALYPAMGASIDIMSSQHLDVLIARCRDVRLLVIDTFSRTHLRDENANGEMAAVMRQYERIAAETGTAVLLMHHIGKGAAIAHNNSHQHAARGASVITDNARWAGYLESETLGTQLTETLHIVHFGASKSNYVPPADRRAYERAAGGVLVPADEKLREQAERVDKEIAARNASVEERLKRPGSGQGGSAQAEGRRRGKRKPRKEA